MAPHLPTPLLTEKPSILNDDVPILGLQNSPVKKNIQKILFIHQILIFLSYKELYI